jgi:hypothetical protein
MEIIDGQCRLMINEFMIKFLKWTGSLLLILTVFMFFGAIFGSSFEKDHTLWLVPILFGGLGVGFYSWGHRLERQLPAHETKRTQTSMGWQVINLLILGFQLCMLLFMLQFGGAIIYAFFANKDFTLFPALFYFLVPTALFLLGSFVRKKLHAHFRK